jgi:hypothetical protein
MLGFAERIVPMRNFTSGLFLLSVGVAMASGCGGNSSAFTKDAGGSSGDAGTGGNGGTGGASGATVGGSGGGSGAGATGGAGGKGGSGTGGSTAGKGGGAGIGTGGTGEAGDGAGGSTVGGSAGMGGTGAMTGYRPPASQVEGCMLTCSGAAEAMCENAPPLEQCVSECRFGIRLEACSDQWDDFFACSSDAEAVCSANGDVTWPDCVAEYAAVVSCAYGDAMDPDLEAPCAESCEAQSSVTCDNSSSTADCRNDCGLLGAAVPVCKTQYMAYLECAAESDFVCDEAGDPQPEGCDSTALPFLACIVTEYDIMF